MQSQISQNDLLFSCSEAPMFYLTILGEFTKSELNSQYYFGYQQELCDANMPLLVVGVLLTARHLVLYPKCSA